ncbi:zonular occludens toxin domain-containing protein [Ralstonia syzygii]|uniref:zonular occludens toxin domain-containing protein n=1 Tax=Ralstonia syzygii TaxID=28097 RepID=UPI001BA896FB|nr:zonular occludens toxin domain-containing protein [Ralstonia syzygii]
MINLLLGAPGGGKSYEGVAYHILPALSAGRKVITNLPLVLEAFPPEQRLLLELVTVSKGKPKPVRAASGLLASLRGLEDEEEVSTVVRPFSAVEDYGDPWRHPESGSGPLYVIDECHFAMPRTGTRREVAEWYSMHRHEHADVLLITQSYGKVCKDIIDLVQVCYRVRKAVAFGTNNAYIRKVQDGVRGDVVNTTVRKYDKKYYKFYRSHTKSSEAGQELAATDIVPFWRRWPVVGFGLCMVVLAILLTQVKGNPMDASQNVARSREKAAKPATVTTTTVVTTPASAPVAGQVGSVAPGARKDEHAQGATDSAASAPKAAQHPFAGMGIHVAGWASNGSQGERYVFQLSQNGVPVSTLYGDELARAGYKVTAVSPCAAKIDYGDVHFFARCDLPRQTMSPGGAVDGKPVGDAAAAAAPSSV